VKPDFLDRLRNINLKDRLPPWMRNRYMITILIFILWLLLLDPNNLISRVRELNTRNRLIREKEYYMGRIEEDKRKLEELRTNNDNLEKFAREQYHMKKPDEDLFIIVTPEEERKIRRERKISKTPKPARERAPKVKNR
jgi:cell division protein DivIC